MTRVALNTPNLFYKVIFLFEYLAMQSRPTVYVSRITNLSDARYCAGMGADMLGFVVDPAHRDYVSPESYQQMIGWIAGPGRVMETGALPSAEVTTAASQYAADYLHITADRLEEFKDGALPLIVEVGFNDADRARKENHPSIAYWMVTDVPDTVEASDFAERSVLIARTGLEGSAAAFLAHCGAAGIVLKGSHEAAPGLKDYDHLSQILEELNG